MLRTLSLLSDRVVDVALGEGNFWLRHLQVCFQGFYLALIVQEGNIVPRGLGLDDLDVTPALLGLDLLVRNCDPLLELSLVLGFGHLRQSLGLWLFGSPLSL